MKQLKIALTALAAESGISQDNWKTVPLEGADLTDVSAVVMTSRDEVPPSYDTIHAFFHSPFHSRHRRCGRKEYVCHIGHPPSGEGESILEETNYPGSPTV